MNASVRQRLALGLRVLFGLGGAVFLVIAFRSTWERSGQNVLPSIWVLLGAGGLVVTGLVFAARGWVTLFGDRRLSPALAHAFYAGQLGKYVPGGVWQAVGQVSLSRRAGVSLPQAATAFPVHALTQAAAGGTVAAGLILAGSDVSLAIRLASLSGLLLLVLLRRSWMVQVLQVVGRVVHRSWPASLIPGQRQILRSYGWAIGNILANGLALALLVWSLHAARPAAAVPAFALAWTIGFLAVPIPAGLGLREAVLIAVISRPGGAALVIAASVAHRLVAIISEAVMIVISRVRGRRPQPISPAGRTAA